MAAARLLVLLACAASQRLDLYEGDICKQDDGGALWKCAQLSNCPRAQGKRQQMCNFAEGGADSVVCCEPDEVAATPSAPGAKSLQKCQDYGELVYTVLPDPLRDHSLNRINSCAVVDPLISSGENAKPREFPHMALIGYGDKPNVEWLCGGSLISERFVLSAAHCTNPSAEQGLANWVRLGEYNMKTSCDDNCGQAQPDEYRIVKRIDHPGFNASNVLYDDIALYQLDQNVMFNGFIRPACLHTTHTFAKTYAIATGWGRTELGGQQSDILQKGNLTIVSRKNCSDAWRSLLLIQYDNTEGIRDASMMCAGDTKKGVGTCQGDSGGPLQLRLQKPYCMYSIIGVTSQGSWCGGNTPGLYTRVSHYVPWIEKIVWT